MYFFLFRFKNSKRLNRVLKSKAMKIYAIGCICALYMVLMHLGLIFWSFNYPMVSKEAIQAKALGRDLIGIIRAVNCKNKRMLIHVTF